jgi:hypothetical protein
MQRIAAHLEECAGCSEEWASLCETQASLAGLGPVPEPDDLVLKIRVRVSQERARSRKRVLQGWSLAWSNSVGPFLLQASAGFASAVVLLGTVITLISMFAEPQKAQAIRDEPLGNPTAPRLLSLSTGAGNNEIGAFSGPVVVEVYINDTGQMYDYRIVSGPMDQTTCSQVENLLLTSVFAPARFFGQPVRGLAVLSFAGVSVRG